MIEAVSSCDNISHCLMDYTVLHRRREAFSYLLPWEPQISPRCMWFFAQSFAMFTDSCAAQTPVQISKRTGWKPPAYRLCVFRLRKPSNITLNAVNPRFAWQDQGRSFLLCIKCRWWDHIPSQDCQGGWTFCRSVTGKVSCLKCMLNPFLFKLFLT